MIEITTTYTQLPPRFNQQMSHVHLNPRCGRSPKTLSNSSTHLIMVLKRENVKCDSTDFLNLKSTCDLLNIQNSIYKYGIKENIDDDYNVSIHRLCLRKKSNISNVAHSSISTFKCQDKKI